jgi:diguanylate cyclase (GGDEF)-like protein
MSYVQIQPETLQATLTFDDASYLEGQLSLLLDGRLEVDTGASEPPPSPTDTHVDDEAEGVDEQEESDRDPARIDLTQCPSSEFDGKYGTLSVKSTPDRPDALKDARVQIISVNYDRATIEFAAEHSEIARRYRQVLTRGFDAKFDTPPTPEPGKPEEKNATKEDPAIEKQKQQAEEPLAAEPEETPQVKSVAASAEFAQLLDHIQGQSTQQLAKAFTPFLKDLVAYLTEEGTRLKKADAKQDSVHTAATRLKQGHARLIKRFMHIIDDYFTDLTPKHSDDQLWKYDIGGPEELDLIDLQEFEDFLRIDRVVTQGEELHRAPMEALTIRLAHLIDADPNTLRNPIHVRQLCRAFQRALLEIEVSREAQALVFAYFSKRFIKQLHHFYAPLNKFLAKQQIAPSVEEDIQEKGTLLEQPAKPARTERPSTRQASPTNDPATTGQAGMDKSQADLNRVHQQLGEQLTGAMGRFTPTSLYKSVVDALNFKREAEGLLDGGALAAGEILSGTWEGETVASKELDQNKLADAEAIAKALGEIQRDSSARESVSESDSLRSYLAQNRESLGELKDSSGLTAESLNQLDMVDNLFDTINSQLDVSGELKPALGNLQIPLAKLALMDPRFFVDHGHTARTVVDRLSQLATSANFPNRALETRIAGIVDKIISEYETDGSVFETALGHIDKLLEQQERALTRNVERVVKTQEGQEKLAQARRAVARLIESLLPEEHVPKTLVDLIESGWRDLLVLTHVKEGTESEGWKEQIRHIELLNSWLTEQLDSGLDDDESVQRSLEAESLLDLIGQQISAALPTNISHESALEELRDILAGTVEIQTISTNKALTRKEPEPEKLRAKIEDLPRLRRWVKRVEQLKKDHWLTYHDKSGNKKRMQLAWISPGRDRYIFVNERGQKVADLSAIKLARQLSRGVQPPAPADKLSAVDQSMYSTLEHVQKTLSFARNHDSLTKLINRETFLDQMERAMRHCRVRHSRHAVLYINIDQFELVNDVYDRVIGDQVLLEFAKLLAQLHGKKSSSARIKADEFAVLLVDQDMAAAMEMAEKIRRDIEASSMDIDGENVTFTVSIGAAAIATYSSSVENILESARSAMQLAKQAGRNRVLQYQEEQTEAVEYKSEKKRSRQNLEEALATDRFALRAQPIVKTAMTDDSNSSLHYELLLGLKTSDGSLASPEEFITSAERYGFMTLVDRWVIREAFNWISQLMDAQKVIPNLSINLSGTSVTDDSFLDYLLEQISEFGVGTSKLCFEITETGTISNLVKAADFVRAFRNIGCKFSIDDFGTGIASHNYLRELPVDYVKIDGSFVTGINENRNDYAMARSINDLAHFLGQETIAECVENDAIIEKLQEIGVDYLQGWGIGKPRLLSEVTQDLSTVEK